MFADDEARLLVDAGTRAVEHRTVADVPRLVRLGDVLVVNTTRVLPARLHLRKPTGGEVEVLLLERLPDGVWEALVRPGRRVRPGAELVAGGDLSVVVGGDGPGGGPRPVGARGAPGGVAPGRGPAGRAGQRPLRARRESSPRFAFWKRRSGARRPPRGRRP